MKGYLNLLRKKKGSVQTFKLSPLYFVLLKSTPIRATSTHETTSTGVTDYDYIATADINIHECTMRVF